MTNHVHLLTTPSRGSSLPRLISLDIQALGVIRHCANTGLVLGTERFREEVRKLRS